MKTNNVFSATSKPPKKYTTVVSTVPVIKLKIDEVEQFVKENVNCFTITEDKVTVERDATKGTAPYSTSYGYTNITINDNNIIFSFFAIKDIIVAIAKLIDA